MANKEQLTILKQGVKVWNAWRNENPAITVGLSGANLNNTDLSNANLTAASLQEAKLVNADLRGANFIDADLSRCNLVYTNLGNADLRDANLSGAELIGAVLIGANLSGANLKSTDLRHANLNSSDLRGANFSGANMSDADLSGANFSRSNLLYAELNGTIFINCNISEILGLETCSYTGPSPIDQETLKQSGRLPEVFLKGIGLDQHFIDQIPGLFWVKNAIEFYSCFISYSHENKAFARRLHDNLQARGIRCWLDEKQMLPGDPIVSTVDQAIRHWDKLILCCSEKSLASDWVEKEIRRGFQKEDDLKKQHSKKVPLLIPLDLDGHILKPECDHPYKADIIDRKVADFKDWEKDSTKYNREFEKVVRALRFDDGAREKPPKPKLGKP